MNTLWTDRFNSASRDTYSCQSAQAWATEWKQLTRSTPRPVIMWIFDQLVRTSIGLITSHWRPTPYRCLHGMAPSYLADDLQLTSTVGTRRQLRSADSPTLVVRSTRRWHSATAHFPWQLHAPGTASRQLLGTRRHFFPPGAAWRHGYLNWHWLHFVCDFSNSVKCPCNVTHVIFTFLIIIIIILRKLYKELSCRRETAWTTRCFVSFNISLSHWRSLKVIWNVILE